MVKMDHAKTSTTSDDLPQFVARQRADTGYSIAASLPVGLHGTGTSKATHTAALPFPDVDLGTAGAASMSAADTLGQQGGSKELPQQRSFGTVAGWFGPRGRNS